MRAQGKRGPARLADVPGSRHPRRGGLAPGGRGPYRIVFRGRAAARSRLVNPRRSVRIMALRSSISQSFLLVGGLRTVAQARELLHRTGARYLVVTVGEAPDHYLLAAAEFEAGAAGADASAALQDSGLLRGRTPAAPRTSAAMEAGGAPALLFQEGRLAGVLTGRAGRRGTRIVSDGDPGGVGEGAPVHYVRAALPEEVPAGETVTLAVEVGAEGSTVPVRLPGGAELDVVVQARHGFAVEGEQTGVLRVPGGGGTARTEFRLRALEPGPGLVKVHAFHDDTPLGTLTLRPEVVRASEPARGGGMARGQRLAAAPQLLSADAVMDRAPASTPDLSLFIVEDRVDGQPVLRIRVTGSAPELGLNYKGFGPVPLRMEPVEYFKTFFEDIRQLGRQREAPPELVRQKLESKGTRLFEAIFPPELRELLWNFRDRIKSVQVQSEEAWIPWELCRLSGDVGDVVDEGAFFCEAFEVTRWIPGISVQRRLTLNNMALVVPDDSGLTAAQEERRYLLAMAGGGRAVTEIPARYMDVRTALASGTYDGFHFSGHGVTRLGDPDRAAILLDDDELMPGEIAGVMRNLRRARPLVFLNSCHGARGAFTLVGVGGWAQRCLEAGAGAFMGAYWSVSDQSACAFATRFYHEVRAGKSLGAAVRTARLSIRSASDPTWLAYTVYGDPAAVVHG
jgi:hypothetical protein